MQPEAPASDLHELLKEIKELKEGLIGDRVTHDNPTFEGPPWRSQQSLQGTSSMRLDIPTEDLDDSLEDLVARDSGLQYILSPQAEAQVAGQRFEPENSSPQTFAPTASGIGRIFGPEVSPAGLPGFPRGSATPANSVFTPPAAAAKQAATLSGSAHMTPVAPRDSALPTGLSSSATPAYGRATGAITTTTPASGASSNAGPAKVSALTPLTTAAPRSKIGSRIARPGAAVTTAPASTATTRTSSVSSTGAALSSPTSRSGSLTQHHLPPHSPSAAATPQRTGVAIASSTTGHRAPPHASTPAQSRNARQKVVATASAIGGRGTPLNAGRSASTMGPAPASALQAARSSSGGSGTSAAAPAAVAVASARKRPPQGAPDAHSSTPARKVSVTASGPGNHGGAPAVAGALHAVATGSSLKQGRVANLVAPGTASKIPGRILQSGHSGSSTSSPVMSLKAAAVNAATPARPAVAPTVSAATTASPSDELKCEVSHPSLTLPTVGGAPDVLAGESLEDMLADDPWLAATTQAEAVAPGGRHSAGGAAPARPLRRPSSDELLRPLADAMAGGHGSSDWMNEDADAELNLLMQGGAVIGGDGDGFAATTPSAVAVGAAVGVAASSGLAPTEPGPLGEIPEATPQHQMRGSLPDTAASELLAAASLRASLEPLGSTVCKVRELLGMDGTTSQKESSELYSEELWRNITADANSIFTEHSSHAQPSSTAMVVPATSTAAAVAAAVATSPRDPSVPTSPAAPSPEPSAAPHRPAVGASLPKQSASPPGAVSAMHAAAQGGVSLATGERRSLTATELAAAAGAMQCDSLDTDDGFLGDLAVEAAAAAAAVVAAGSPTPVLMQVDNAPVAPGPAEEEYPAGSRRLLHQSSSASSFGFDATVAFEAAMISRQLAGGGLALRTNVSGEDPILEGDEATSASATPQACAPPPVLELVDVKILPEFTAAGGLSSRPDLIVQDGDQDEPAMPCAASATTDGASGDDTPGGMEAAVPAQCAGGEATEDAGPSCSVATVASAATAAVAGDEGLQADMEIDTAMAGAGSQTEGTTALSLADTVLAADGVLAAVGTATVAEPLLATDGPGAVADVERGEADSDEGLAARATAAIAEAVDMLPDNVGMAVDDGAPAGAGEPRVAASPTACSGAVAVDPAPVEGVEEITVDGPDAADVQVAAPASSAVAAAVGCSEADKTTSTEDVDMDAQSAAAADEAILADVGPSGGPATATTAAAAAVSASRGQAQTAADATQDDGHLAFAALTDATAAVVAAAPVTPVFTPDAGPGPELSAAQELQPGSLDTDMEDVGGEADIEESCLETKLDLQAPPVPLVGAFVAAPLAVYVAASPVELERAPRLSSADVQLAGGAPLPLAAVVLSSPASLPAVAATVAVGSARAAPLTSAESLPAASRSLDAASMDAPSPRVAATGAAAAASAVTPGDEEPPPAIYPSLDAASEDAPSARVEALDAAASAPAAGEEEPQGSSDVYAADGEELLAEDLAAASQKALQVPDPIQEDSCGLLEDAVPVDAQLMLAAAAAAAGTEPELEECADAVRAGGDAAEAATEVSADVEAAMEVSAKVEALTKESAAAAMEAATEVLSTAAAIEALVATAEVGATSGLPEDHADDSEEISAAPVHDSYTPTAAAADATETAAVEMLPESERMLIDAQGMSEGDGTQGGAQIAVATLAAAPVLAGGMEAAESEQEEDCGRTQPEGFGAEQVVGSSEAAAVAARGAPADSTCPPPVLDAAEFVAALPPAAAAHEPREIPRPYKATAAAAAVEGADDAQQLQGAAAAVDEEMFNGTTDDAGQDGPTSTPQVALVDEVAFEPVAASDAAASQLAKRGVVGDGEPNTDAVADVRSEAPAAESATATGPSSGNAAAGGIPHDSSAPVARSAVITAAAAAKEPGESLGADDKAFEDAAVSTGSSTALSVIGTSASEMHVADAGLLAATVITASTAVADQTAPAPEEATTAVSALDVAVEPFGDDLAVTATSVSHTNTHCSAGDVDEQMYDAEEEGFEVGQQATAASALEEASALPHCQDSPTGPRATAAGVAAAAASPAADAVDASPSPGTAGSVEMEAVAESQHSTAPTAPAFQQAESPARPSAGDASFRASFGGCIDLPTASSHQLDDADYGIDEEVDKLVDEGEGDGGKGGDGVPEQLRHKAPAGAGAALLAAAAATGTVACTTQAAGDGAAPSIGSPIDADSSAAAEAIPMEGAAEAPVTTRKRARLASPAPVTECMEASPGGVTSTAGSAAPSGSSAPAGAMGEVDAVVGAHGDDATSTAVSVDPTSPKPDSSMTGVDAAVGHAVLAPEATDVIQDATTATASVAAAAANDEPMGEVHAAGAAGMGAKAGSNAHHADVTAFSSTTASASEVVTVTAAAGAAEEVVGAANGLDPVSGGLSPSAAVAAPGPAASAVLLRALPAQAMTLQVPDAASPRAPSMSASPSQSPNVVVHGAAADGELQPLLHAWQVLVPTSLSTHDGEAEGAPTSKGSLGAKRSLRCMLSGSSRLSRVSSRRDEDAAEAEDADVSSTAASPTDAAPAALAAADAAAGTAAPVLGAALASELPKLVGDNAGTAADGDYAASDVSTPGPLTAAKVVSGVGHGSEDVGMKVNAPSDVATATAAGVAAAVALAASSRKSLTACDDDLEQLLPAWKVAAAAADGGGTTDVSFSPTAARSSLGVRRSLRSLPVSAGSSRLKRNTSQSTLIAGAAPDTRHKDASGAAVQSFPGSLADIVPASLICATSTPSAAAAAAAATMPAAAEYDSDDDEALSPAWKVLAMPGASPNDSPDAVMAARCVPLGSQPSFRSCRAGSSRLRRGSAPDAEDFDFADTVGGAGAASRGPDPPFVEEGANMGLAAPGARSGPRGSVVDTGTVLVLGRSRSHTTHGNDAAVAEAAARAQEAPAGSVSADGWTPPPLLRGGSIGRVGGMAGGGISSFRRHSGLGVSSGSPKRVGFSENGGFPAAWVARVSSRRLAPEAVGSVPIPRRSAGGGDPNVDALRPAWQVLPLLASPGSPPANLDASGATGGSPSGGAPPSAANMLASMRSSSRLSRMSSGIPDDLLAELRLQAQFAVGHLQGSHHGDDSGGGLADMNSSMEESGQHVRFPPGTADVGSLDAPKTTASGDGAGGTVHAWKVLPLRMQAPVVTGLASTAEDQACQVSSGSAGGAVPLAMPLAMARGLSSRPTLATARAGNQSSRLAVASTKAPLLQVCLEPVSPCSVHSPMAEPVPEVGEEEEEEEGGPSAVVAVQPVPAPIPAAVGFEEQGVVHAWKLVPPPPSGSASGCTSVASPGAATAAAAAGLGTSIDGSSSPTALATRPPQHALGARRSLKSMGSMRGSRLSRTSLAAEDYVDDSYSEKLPALTAEDDEGGASSEGRHAADRIAPADAANQSAIAAAAEAAAAAGKEDADVDRPSLDGPSERSSAPAAIGGLPPGVLYHGSHASGSMQRNSAGSRSTPGSRATGSLHGDDVALEDGAVPDSPITRALNARPSLRSSRSSNSSRLSRVSSAREAAAAAATAAASAGAGVLLCDIREEDGEGQTPPQSAGGAPPGLRLTDTPPVAEGPGTTLQEQRPAALQLQATPSPGSPFADAVSAAASPDTAPGLRQSPPSAMPYRTPRTGSAGSSRLSRMTSMTSDVGLEDIVEEGAEAGGAGPTDAGGAVASAVGGDADEARDNSGPLPYDRASSGRAPPPAPSAGSARIGCPATGAAALSRSSAPGGAGPPATGLAIPEAREDADALVPAWKVLVPAVAGSPADARNGDTSGERVSPSAPPGATRQASLRLQRSGSVGNSRLSRMTSGLDEQEAESAAGAPVKPAAGAADGANRSPGSSAAPAGAAAETPAGSLSTVEASNAAEAHGRRISVPARAAIDSAPTQDITFSKLPNSQLDRGGSVSHAAAPPHMGSGDFNSLTVLQGAAAALAASNNIKKDTGVSGGHQPPPTVIPAEAGSQAAAAADVGVDSPVKSPAARRGRGLFACLGCFGGSAVAE